MNDDLDIQDVKDALDRFLASRGVTPTAPGEGNIVDGMISMVDRVLDGHGFEQNTALPRKGYGTSKGRAFTPPTKVDNHATSPWQKTHYWQLAQKRRIRKNFF